MGRPFFLWTGELSHCNRRYKQEWLGSEHFVVYVKQLNCFWDFPGHTVVETLSFQGRELRV